MSFTWPWAFAALLLPALVLAYAWWARRRRRRRALRVTSVALVRAAVPRHSSWRRRVPAGVLLLGLGVLAVGAARPQASVPVVDNSTSILLALDISGSMCSTDVDPNRLTAAEKAAEEFVDSQSGGPRIGLVTFAGTAGLPVPPTDDTDELLDALDGLTTSRGTAIGQAILTAIDAIAEIDPTVAPTGATADREKAAGYAPDVIVVLTDGANTQGVPPRTAARQAAERGVRVFTIGFGTTSPSALVCSSSQIGDDGLGGWGGGPGGAGGYGGNPGPGGWSGNPLLMDESTLQAVARTTGGEYYRAENAKELSDALRDLPSNLTLTHKDVDLAAWFAGAGGLLVATAVGLSLWFNRVRTVPGGSPR